MFNARERLSNFQKGLEILSQENSEATTTMLGFVDSALKEGVLTVREKELVAIGISVYTGCEDCIAVHTYKALEAGCTRQEILEAAATTMVFGGGPALGATASLLLQALDEFTNDFQVAAVAYPSPDPSGTGSSPSA
jgi:AhpD family alkylhydroperoxidase